MSKVNKKYTKAIKLKAVDMYLNQGIGATDIARELELADRRRVYTWVKQFQEKGDIAFDEETRGKATGSKKGRQKAKFDSLEEEVKYLRMENEFLKKLKALRRK